MQVVIDVSEDGTMGIDVVHSLKNSQYGDPAFAAQLGMASALLTFLENLFGFIEVDTDLEVTDDDTTESIVMKVSESIEGTLYAAASRMLTNRNTTEDWTDMFRKLGKEKPDVV